MWMRIRLQITITDFFFLSLKLNWLRLYILTITTQIEDDIK